MSSTKGVNNDHELLKQADTQDDCGMVKYAIDLEPGMLKESSPHDKLKLVKNTKEDIPNE